MHRDRLSISVPVVMFAIDGGNSNFGGPANKCGIGGSTVILIMSCGMSTDVQVLGPEPTG